MSILIGFVFGSILCGIGVLFERMSRNFKGIGALSMAQSGVLIKMALGISVSVALVHLQLVDTAEYVVTFSFMTCVMYPICIFIAQRHRISVYKKLK